jgi:hypothetical protein
MPRLTKNEQADRLSLIDYRLAKDLRCPVMQISAHATKADASRGVNPITREADARNAWYYRVNYHIETLIGQDRYSDPERDPVQLLIDLNFNGNYPFSRPESFVIGHTIPWSPHFAPGIQVCFEHPGRVWRSDGRTTLGHLVIHLAKLINFDETIANPYYQGYNGEAVRFWRSALHSRPITPGLIYPELPAWYFSGDQASSTRGAAPSAQPTQPRVVGFASGGRAVVIGRVPKATVVEVKR